MSVGGSPRRASLICSGESGLGGGAAQCHRSRWLGALEYAFVNTRGWVVDTGGSVEVLTYAETMDRWLADPAFRSEFER